MALFMYDLGGDAVNLEYVRLLRVVKRHKGSNVPPLPTDKTSHITEWEWAVYAETEETIYVLHTAETEPEARGFLHKIAARASSGTGPSPNADPVFVRPAQRFGEPHVRER